MNYIYLSPEFPPNYKNFILALHRGGARVFGIGEVDFYSMPEDLRSALAWYVRCDMGDTNAFLLAADFLVREVIRGRVDVVESHNEHWMRHEALLNERFDVEGIRPADIDRLRKKYRMKELFRANGIPVAEGCLTAGDREACLAFARKAGYPLVLKPNQGVGAFGVFKVDDEHQLLHHLERIDRQEYVLERFINGRIVTYDGMTDRQGRVVFHNSLIYGCGVLESVQGLDTFFYSVRDIPEDLAALGKKIVSIFGIRRKFFHFEFFEAGGLRIPLEINARPPGGPILDMMNYGADCDLYRDYARMLKGQPVKAPAEKKYLVGFAGRKEKSYLLCHEDVLSRFGHRIVEEGESPPLYWAGMGRYRYIFRSPVENEILSIRDQVLALRDAA
ncbi:MAG: ATP-grasp domain-containing protein [Elusimicrobiota bacterium]